MILRADIKKPDIKLVGKIDLDKTVKPKTVPSKEEPEKKPAKKTAESEKELKEERLRH